MCRAANMPSTMAQQKAATTPKLMNTMAANSWGRGQRSEWALHAPNNCSPGQTAHSPLLPELVACPAPALPDTPLLGGLPSCRLSTWQTGSFWRWLMNKLTIERSAISHYYKLCSKDPNTLCLQLWFLWGNLHRTNPGVHRWDTFGSLILAAEKPQGPINRLHQFAPQLSSTCVLIPKRYFLLLII